MSAWRRRLAGLFGYAVEYGLAWGSVGGLLAVLALVAWLAVTHLVWGW